MQECFNCPYSNDSFPTYAEAVPGGPSAAMLQEAARKHSVYLVGGALPVLFFEHIARAWGAHLPLNACATTQAPSPSVKAISCTIRASCTTRRETSSPSTERWWPLSPKRLLKPPLNNESFLQVHLFDISVPSGEGRPGMTFKYVAIQSLFAQRRAAPVQSLTPCLFAGQGIRYAFTRRRHHLLYNRYPSRDFSSALLKAQVVLTPFIATLL